MIAARRRLILLSLGFLMLAGCAKKPEQAAEPLPEGKRYAMQGVVKALDKNTKIADIDAGQIGDWMGPMTMPYPIKPDADFFKLNIGDQMEGTVVVVNDTTYYVTGVKVVPKK